MTLSAGKVDLLTKVFTMNTRLLKELQKHQTSRPLLERLPLKPNQTPAYIEAITLVICGLVIIAGITWGSL